MSERHRVQRRVRRDPFGSEQLRRLRPRVHIPGLQRGRVCHPMLESGVRRVRRDLRGPADEQRELRWLRRRVCRRRAVCQRELHMHDRQSSGALLGSVRGSRDERGELRLVQHLLRAQWRVLGRSMPRQRVRRAADIMREHVRQSSDRFLQLRQLRDFVR